MTNEFQSIVETLFEL
ncbi:MAG: hypothetical protein EHM20_16455 [Alphaproteobacteria bacterium]|nr:MAG: hypothetical protein EHM20_16455 [Alphaproteobacteria bacterium]